MNKYSLKAQKRNLLGKKVKKVRMENRLPANIYGRKIKSQAVDISLSEFQKIYKQAGETDIVDLRVDTDEVRPVLIHNVQKDVLTKLPLHVDFYQVDLKQKIKTKVPVILEGKSPAVEQKAGLLLQILNEVEIEALPTDLPKSIKMDISSLTQVDQELKTADLSIPSGVTLLTSSSLGVAKIAQLVSKEAEELEKQEQAAAEAAKATSQAETATTSTAEAPEAPQETAPKAAENPAKPS